MTKLELFWLLPQIFSRFLLFLLGWGPPPIKDIENKKGKNKNAILLFSHTSYWDFWLIILYKFGYPEFLADVYTVMKPQAMEAWYGFWLPWCNFIPATRLEDVSNGFVDRNVTLIESLGQCYILIAPKGMMKLNKWRSGYYHLAKKMEAPIYVTGLDFEKHQLRVLAGHSPDNYGSYEEMERILQEKMGQIIPLYVDRVPYNLRSYDATKISGWHPTSMAYISIILLTFSYFMVTRAHNESLTIYGSYYILIMIIRQSILWYTLENGIYFNHYVIILILEFLLLLRLPTGIIGYLLIINYCINTYICFMIWIYGPFDIIKNHKIIVLSQLFTLLYLIG